ncbi:MAG: queuine tRNA-ribosyltransferase [Candidatus Berkelbacteria bacterium Licking1014_2]|uniref:Queuine tRNA-ribosyltransferase n=1 Tax=Candidatus Berkelbacteria bacterium Licking1014_2 TaxID=2017146 RepID=A0A554LW92_9BACT|nr:MAG: queuine tRNA-ribosyltransferase [Candidatus Berkelbacteria bacterium Licking1014_2]
MESITTKHGEIKTPSFLPCATYGVAKGILPEELIDSGTTILLCNIYHLYLRPGIETIKKAGGIHKFINWNKPILTDSGGFQTFSLRPKISANGVEFNSHLDGSRHFLTPEKVIKMQAEIGVDIAMPLDVCPASTVPRERIRRAVWQTTRWLEKTVICYQKISGQKSLLFAIVQGGIDEDLRREAVEKIKAIEKKHNFSFAGWAIGGLAVGEGKKELYKIVALMNKILPKDKPRYLMGVGEPADLVYSIKNGIDLFDCVLPTRLGRHGVAFVKSTELDKSAQLDKFDKLNLNKSLYQNDWRPISKDCSCPACRQKFSRAYLHHLIKVNDPLAGRLLSLHNLYFINQICHP